MQFDHVYAHKFSVIFPQKLLHYQRNKMLLYSLYLLGYLLTGEINNFAKWNSFFESSLNKTLSLIFFADFAVHTWFGTWAGASDYLTPRIFGSFGRILYLIFRGIVKI